MNFTFTSKGLAALVLAGVCSATHAAIVTDAAGDLIPSFTPGDAAPHGDVDVVSSEVTLNKATNQLIFSGTHASNIGTSLNSAGVANAIYVWGLDRGQGAALLAGIGATNVLFDSVVVLRADSTAAFIDIVGGAPPVNLPGIVTIAGPTISGTVNVSIIPALIGGFALEDWTWNLWPRFISAADPALLFTDPAVSDFAPDNSNARLTVVAAVSEPASLGVMAFGLAALGWQRRRRERQ